MLSAYVGTLCSDPNLISVKPMELIFKEGLADANWDNLSVKVGLKVVITFTLRHC